MQNNSIVLVCVTPQQSGKHLITYGQRLAQERGCVLRILSVLPLRQGFSPDLSVLEMLNDAARESGAEMTVCFSDSPADKVCEIVRDGSVEMLLAGFPGKHSSHFLQSLHEKMPILPLWLVDADGTAYTFSHVSAPQAQSDGTFRVVLQGKPTV